MSSYTTYVNAETVMEFLSDCPFEVNKAEAKEYARKFKNNFVKTMTIQQKNISGNLQKVWGEMSI